MKKSISVLIVSVLLCACAVGCGSKEDNSVKPSSEAIESTAASAQEEKTSDNTETVELATEAEPETVAFDMEIQRAVDLGIVTYEEMLKADEMTGGKSMTILMDRMVSLVSPEAFESYKSKYNLLRLNKKHFRRLDAMIYTFLTARDLGEEYISGMDWERIWRLSFYGAHVDIDSNSKNLNGLLFDSALEDEHFETDNEDRVGICDYALFFSLGKVSNFSGKGLFDTDPGTGSLRIFNDVTFEEMVKATVRLYDSQCDFLSESVTCNVKEETLKKAEEMPDATWNSLPDWHGYTLSFYDNPDRLFYFDENFISVLAAQGFDFVRVPLTFNPLFSEDSTEKVCPNAWNDLDILLDNCAKYAMHVCFDLHDMPGFTTDKTDENDILFTDEETQKLFVDFWSFMAKHFESVPSSLLSFNLLNEPHAHSNEELTDEQYSKLMLKAIDAIREVSPDRLIFADAIGVRVPKPVEGLKDAKVAQALHTYILPDGFKSWPVYYASYYIDTNAKSFTINGDFSEGDTISLKVYGAPMNTKLTLYLDGKETDSFEIGNEELDTDCCSAIMEEGTKNEWRFYDNRWVESVISKDCKTIKLALTGKGQWIGINVIHAGDAEICCDGQIFDGERITEVTIDSDGTISSKKSGTVMKYDREKIEELMSVYDSFSKRTGVAFMVQEFGFSANSDYEATLSAADDFMAAFDKYNIPWTFWSGNFGPIMDKRIADCEDDSADYREGADYSLFHDYYLVDEGFMDVIKQHMK